jgi:hypothetical protein
VDPWDNEYHQHDHHAAEASDDGWVTEYPQQDYHDSEMPQTDEIPEISTTNEQTQPAADEPGKTKPKDDPA